jgi:hypothetical protein
MTTKMAVRRQHPTLTQTFSRRNGCLHSTAATMMRGYTSRIPPTRRCPSLFYDDAALRCASRTRRMGIRPSKGTCTRRWKHKVATSVPDLDALAGNQSFTPATVNNDDGDAVLRRPHPTHVRACRTPYGLPRLTTTRVPSLGSFSHVLSTLFSELTRKGGPARTISTWVRHKHQFTSHSMRQTRLQHRYGLHRKTKIA